LAFSESLAARLANQDGTQTSRKQCNMIGLNFGTQGPAGNPQPCCCKIFLSKIAAAAAGSAAVMAAF
jgi:hypothetical protein